MEAMAMIYSLFVIVFSFLYMYGAGISIKVIMLYVVVGAAFTVTGHVGAVIALFFIQMALIACPAINVKGAVTVINQWRQEAIDKRTGKNNH